MTRSQLSLVVLIGLALSPQVRGQVRQLTAAQQAFVQKWPGYLVREHQALDVASRCDSCHVGYTKAIDDNKCLDCHKKLRISRRGGGFHGQDKVRKRRCTDCHLDHKGRSFNIMGWKSQPRGEKGFDHEQTNWRLVATHGTLECKKCHMTMNSGGRRVYLGLSSACTSCHQAISPHGDLSEHLDCDRCHSQVAWSLVFIFDFDHDRETSYELAPLHSGLACAGCHPKALYNLGPDVFDCVDCHAWSPRFDLAPARCSTCHPAGAAR